MRATAASPTRPATQESAHTGLLFGAYSLLYFAAAYLTNEFVLTEELLRNEWTASFDANRVHGMLDQRRKWMLIGYGFIPLIVAMKILFATLCLSTGCVVADWTIGLRDLFRMAVRAEIVFAIAAVVHLVWSLVEGGYASMAEYAGFYPFSALHLVAIDASELWMAYPLKTVNAFEVAYVGVLTWQIKVALRRPVRQALLLVLCSYGLGLLLIVSAVTFLTLYLL